MSLFQVGRTVIKVAGRDAGRKAVIVEVLDSGRVLIDGETRRRAVNVRHLEPLAETLDISSGASHQEVAVQFAAQGISLPEHKSKKAGEKPKPQRGKLRKAERLNKVPAKREKAKQEKLKDKSGVENENPNRPKGRGI